MKVSGEGNGGKEEVGATVYAPGGGICWVVFARDETSKDAVDGGGFVGNDGVEAFEDCIDRFVAVSTAPWQLSTTLVLSP